MEKEAKKKIYCAIYTRKSTTEGLDQDFTSLDAQRESAENYIKSQKHEGWVVLPGQYYDGGFTGANIDRPALQKLLADIKTGGITCVVVYKVDRLSRSLMDFSKLLEFFDKYNVTFVSVTQQFNTNTSMGRLTLNILLSFAQFEREIISERTKDKMAAARKKGQWLGGRPPFGYDTEKDGKKLLINQEEAKIVRDIFKLYLEGNSLLKLALILNDRGHRSKQGTSRKGNAYGGKKFGVTQMQTIIKNVLYIGKVKYAGQIYDGQQEAIIDEETFNKAQKKLKENRVERKALKNTECTGLLTRLLRCNTCNTFMFHTYTMKKPTVKYRYYVCTNAQKRGYQACPNKSVNAQAVEDLTIECLKHMLSDKKKFKDPTKEMEALVSPIWSTLYPEEKRRILRTIVKEVYYQNDAKKLGIILNGSDLRLEFDIDLKQVRPLNKWHKEKEIKKEPKIRQNLMLAYQIQQLISKEKIPSLKQAAEWLNISHVRIDQLMNMLLLSPKIQEEIITSDDPNIASIPEYKLRSVTNESDWQQQDQLWRELAKTQA
jgi:DNA invertase Pin-like site-specific DNA recombinase/predicted XRE-type DNA-binding protein